MQMLQPVAISGWGKLSGHIKRLTLGKLLVMLSIVAVLAAFLLIFFMSGVVRDRAIRELARDNAQQTSKMVFQSLYSVMRKGWNKAEINEAIERLNTSFPDLQIRVYRSGVVARQFGEMAGEREDILADVRLSRALESGHDAMAFPNSDSIRYLYPIVATQECLACHTQSHVGAVHGVIDITYPTKTLNASFSEVINSIVAYTLLVIAGVFVILYLKLHYMVATDYQPGRGHAQRDTGHGPEPPRDGLQLAG